MNRPSAWFMLPLAYIPPVVILLSILRSIPSITAISFLVAMFLLYGLICFKEIIGIPEKYWNVGLQKLVNQSSSLMVSLGIAGTFIGIVMGLSEFNVKAIGKSVPALLEGLKTAFITSVFGILLSIFLKLIHSLAAVGQPALSSRKSIPGSASVAPSQAISSPRKPATPMEQLQQKLQARTHQKTLPEEAHPLTPSLDNLIHSELDEWSAAEAMGLEEALQSESELMESMESLQNTMERLCAIQEKQLLFLQKMDQRLKLLTSQHTAVQGSKKKSRPSLEWDKD